MPTENRSSNTVQMVSAGQAAFKEWVDKSQWARKGAMADELGMHLADVIKQRFDILCAELAERDSLLRNFIEESEPDFVSLSTVDRAKAALSASAEPAPTPEGFSAEQMTAQGADGYRNGIKAAAELAADYTELAQAIRDLPLPR